MTFAVGETVGPYRILEQHGQGGMATVFKAYHASLDRYVALKVLHPAFKEDPNFLARFQREARVIAKLEHPNIVPVYDFSEHEGRPYLVLKFIEGETLKARLQRGNLTIAEILKVVEATGAALTYAHKQGILHRDVKPSNVLLSKDGQIYLADFGLARIASAGESTLSSDMLVGTPQYISPEQALGKKELDAGTDIYSLGVMIYEMVVGRVPFSADTPYAIIHDHIYTPLPLPHKINPNVPEVLERVLLKALAKDRADRFADVETLVDAFKYAVEVSGMLPPPAEAEKDWAAVTRPVSDLGGADLDEVSPSLLASMQTRPAVPSDEISPSGLSPMATRPASGAMPLPPAAPISHSAARPISAVQPKPRSSRSLWWLWALALLTLLVVCACGWIVTMRIRAATRNDRDLDGVARALQVAEANPNDPYAQFDLALAYADHQQPEAARQQFEKAMSLGGGDGQFYAHAGEKMAARGAWLYAAKAYFLMVENYPPPLPEDYHNAWREAIYRAYREPQAAEIVPVPAIREVDEPMSVIAQAEVELSAGRPLAAMTIVEGVIKLRGEFPEARLLQAEIFLRSQSPDKARPILEGLSNDNDIPDWVREEAERLLGEIP